MDEDSTPGRDRHGCLLGVVKFGQGNHYGPTVL
jgi:hypothetical protein